MITLPTVSQFHGAQVRVINRQGSLWFVSADICRVLEIVIPTRATERLYEREKGLHLMKTPGSSPRTSPRSLAVTARRAPRAS